jgi:hypothetical protein
LIHRVVTDEGTPSDTAVVDQLRVDGTEAGGRAAAAEDDVALVLWTIFARRTWAWPLAAPLSPLPRMRAWPEMPWT